jgi:hypothetical protein
MFNNKWSLVNDSFNKHTDNDFEQFIEGIVHEINLRLNLVKEHYDALKEIKRK